MGRPKSSNRRDVSRLIFALWVYHTTKTFALKVRGESMVDAHICDGDTVVLEFREPRNGDVVAALIDGETTLKRYIKKAGEPAYLQAENELFPDLIPARELVIQGVMVALLEMQLDDFTLKEHGFAIVPSLLSPSKLEGLRTELGQIAVTEGAACVRDLLRKSALVADWVRTVRVRSVVGSGMVPVRALLFDKCKGSNWPVAWHQI